MAVEEQCHGTPLDNMAVFDDADASSPQAALIQAAIRRANLLRQKPAVLTGKERSIIQQGDKALQQLLQSHQGLIRSLVRTYWRVSTHGWGYATEEATLAFYEAVDSYDLDKGASLATWAYIHIRSRLQQLNHRTIELTTATTILEEHSWSEPQPGPEVSLPEGFPSLFVRLTLKQQQVVVLQLQGLSWAEIALSLKSSVNAVRMRWTRAVNRLRRLFLGDQHPEVSPHNHVESRPPHALQNWGQPLLKRLLRHQTESLINVGSLGQSIYKPGLRRWFIASTLGNTPSPAQRRETWGKATFNPPGRCFFQFTKAIDWLFRSDATSTNEIRGSPIPASNTASFLIGFPAYVFIAPQEFPWTITHPI